MVLTPTFTPTPSPTPAPQPDVRIVCILFDGEEPRTEADEYVEIANVGNGPQELSGWKLIDVTQGTPQFVFPSYALQPGAVIRVYTNQVNAEWGGFSFGHGAAIWNNVYYNTAALYDEAGQFVSSKSYNPTQPPGCE